MPESAIVARAATPPPPPSPRAAPRRAPSAVGPWQAIELATAQLLARIDAESSIVSGLQRTIEAMQARLADQASLIVQLSRDRTEAAAAADTERRLAAAAAETERLQATAAAERAHADVAAAAARANARLDALVPLVPASMMIDAAGDLVAVLSDGDTRSIGRVRGEDGGTGATLTDAIVNEHGRLEIRMTDGRRIDAGHVRGQDAPPPAPVAHPAAADAATAEAARAHARLDALAPMTLRSLVVDDAGDLVAVTADGAMQRVGRVKGQDGINGATIADAAVNEHGRLEIRMTDGRRIDAGHVRGADGTLVAPAAAREAASPPRANRALAHELLAGIKGVTASAVPPPWAALGISRATFYRRGLHRS
jgi:hypothetical protein